MPEDDIRVLYARATYGAEEKEAVNEVLEHPESLVGGDFTANFEDRIADRFGKENGIMVNSGSSANLLAVRSLDLPEGAEIVTPIVTFSTTVAPIIQCGLTPVFVDADPGTYLANLDQVEEAIGSDTEALLIPNLLGNVPDFRRLRELADTHDLTLIEDSADTLGARFAGEPTGTYADISTTSFYGSHVITAFGGGGMVCVDDDQLMKRIRKLRGWGRSSAADETEDIDERLNTSLDGIQYDSKFVFDEIGYNFLPLEASAAFGIEQEKKLDEFTRRRNENFAALFEFFEQHEDLFVLPEEHRDVDTCWLAFPLTIRDDAPFSRADIVRYLEKNDIQTRSLWSGNLLKHPGFDDIECRLPFEYSNANDIMRSAFVVGCHQSIDERQLSYLTQTFTDFIDDHR